MTDTVATLTVLSSLPVSHDPAGLCLPNRSFSCIDPCVVRSTELQGDQVLLLFAAFYRGHALFMEKDGRVDLSAWYGLGRNYLRGRTFINSHVL